MNRASGGAALSRGFIARAGFRSLSDVGRRTLVPVDLAGCASATLSVPPHHDPPGSVKRCEEKKAPHATNRDGALGDEVR